MLFWADGVEPVSELCVVDCDNTWSATVGVPLVSVEALTLTSAFPAVEITHSPDVEMLVFGVPLKVEYAVVAAKVLPSTESSNSNTPKYLPDTLTITAGAFDKDSSAQELAGTQAVPALVISLFVLVGIEGAEGFGRSFRDTLAVPLLKSDALTLIRAIAGVNTIHSPVLAVDCALVAVEVE